MGNGLLQSIAITGGLDFIPDIYTPEVSQFAPENGWLEDDPFLLGFGNFSGANC